MILNKVIFIVVLLGVGHSVGSETCKYSIITEFSQQTCIDQSEEDKSYYLKQDECTLTCLQYDFDINKSGPCPPGYIKDKRCTSDTSIPCDTMSDCPTLSRCSEICVPDIQCMSYHAYTSDYKDTYYSAKFFKPQCLDDGSWAPKQCKGGKTGRCFCFDGDGKRIFGEALYDESEDMTCACSRRKVELIQAGIRNYVFFHCDSKGNYEKLQCDRDHCWCVEPKTGELNSTVVPKTAMKYLPCYSSLIVGNQYLRQCESEKYAQEMIIEELKYHGVEHTNFRYLICDGDGAFGAFNVSNSRPYCTWRDGSLIGSYQGNDMNEVLTINCNCARDNKRYGLNSECIYNGNYAETQYIQSTSQFYCVDADGFAKSDPYSSGTHVNCRDFY